ncbi:hypothetical protein KC19_6G049000 [Ceratodon purpureus]|uniref:Fanconi Anaemia group E protein C-terminal domain-containing protein n=1 Tax=Ceratodon purpureus TaxID=3225 RepID=A0A8T0HAF9_CERPU|nr:hypothetical protein KC19_6G049000 [Ceratodon purpureus]
MQTDILTFLSAERRHFLSKDLVVLASTLLAARDTDFWVRLAASSLLNFQNGYTPTLSQKQALDEYNSLPSWLEEYKGSESALISDLPPRQEDARTENNDEALGQAEEELAKKITSNGGDKVIHIDDDQDELPTSRAQSTSQTLLGKRKHDANPEIDSQHTSPQAQVKEGPAPENTMPGSDNLEAVSDEDDNTAKEILGEDLFSRAKNLGISLQSNSSHLGLPSDIEIMSIASNLSLVLKLIKPWLADDETTSLLVGALLGEQSGYAQSTQILTHVLLPKLTSMQEPPSRTLGSAVLQAGKAHPRATVDAIIIPLLVNPEAGSTVKCDLINRVVKECFSPEGASSLCNRLFCPRTEEQKLHSWVWTEGTVGVVHTLLSLKVALEEAALEGMISLLEQYCNQFSASLKFSNLLLNLVTKYGSQIKPYKAVLQQVVSSTKTFLTKSILAKVNAL